MQKNMMQSPMQAALAAIGMTDQQATPVAGLGLEQPRCACGGILELGQPKLDTGESAKGRGGIMTYLGVCPRCETRQVVVIRFAATITVNPIPNALLGNGGSALALHSVKQPAMKNVTPTPQRLAQHEPFGDA